MKKSIAIILTFIFIFLVFTSCKIQKIESEDIIAGEKGSNTVIDNEPNAKEPEDSIEESINEVDTVDEEITDEELDSSFDDIDNLLDNW